MPGLQGSTLSPVAGSGTGDGEASIGSAHPPAGHLELETVRRLHEASKVRPPASVGRLYLVWILLLASLLSWRTGTYYSGGLDPTVAAKALLSLIALGVCVDSAVRARPRARLGPRTLALVLIYIAATMFGADANGTLLASTVLAVRLLIVLAAVSCIMIAYPLADVIRTAMISMALAGIVCAASGIGSLAHGRLTGGLIPVQPNQLAMLFGPPVVWLVWRLVHGTSRPMLVVALFSLLGLTWLTGSRTGLIALLVAVIIVLLSAPRLPVGGFLALLAIVPGLFYVVLFTGTLTQFVNRDGSGNVATLSSRTIAWNAAFSAPADFWQHWFGGGLAVKTVAVSGTYWNTQVLDSSWVSAYVQGGVVGITVMGLFALTAIAAAIRTARPMRALLLALIMYALIRSGLENGLIDSYVLFVAMLIPTLATELRPARSTGDQAPTLAAAECLGWERRTMPEMSALSSVSRPSISTNPR